jgi:uncharacterized protein (TIGR03435 family)
MDVPPTTRPFVLNVRLSGHVDVGELRRVASAIDVNRREWVSGRFTAVLACCCLVCPSAFGQTISVVDDAKLPRFDVVSVKRGDPNADSARFGFPPGRFYQENLELLSALLAAFQIRPYELAEPLPDLVRRARFTIDGRPPAGAPRTDVPLMLRTLLIDRFKLRYHIEHGATDGYILTLARRDGRLGSKMRPSPVDCSARLVAAAQKEPVPPLPPGAAECGIRNARGLLDFGGMPIATLVTMLSNQVGGPVIDQTGLTGNYDVVLRFSVGSAGLPTATNPAPSVVDDAPSIFTAVREQLGLKLTPAKAPMDRLVIDHIEQPEPD